MECNKCYYGDGSTFSEGIARSFGSTSRAECKSHDNSTGLIESCTGTKCLVGLKSIENPTKCTHFGALSTIAGDKSLHDFKNISN